MKHSLRGSWGRRSHDSPPGTGQCTGIALRDLYPPGLVLVFFLCAAGVFGQTGDPSGTQAVRRITPDEAVELAIQNNLNLESARVALDTKKRKSDLVWNQFLPELDIRGSLARTNEASPPVSVTIPIPGTGTPMSFNGVSGRFKPDFFVTDPRDVPQWHITGNFSATLTFSFALIEGIRSIKMDYQTGLLTYAKAKSQMERDIRKSYYQMLLLQENIGLLRESYAAAERQVTMARANYNAGLAPQLTLLQAQVSRDNMKPNIDQAENGLKLAMANFAMNLGLDYDTQFELVPVEGAPNYISLELRDLISKASQGKPDIMELRQTILSTESGRKAQSLQLHTPYLRFDWAYSPAFTGDPWKDNWFKNDSWKDSGAFSITLGMSLNSLFPFTKQGQGLKDMDNTLRTLNIGLVQAIRGTEIEIYNTVFSLEKAQVTAEAQAQTVELAERTYRLTEEAYRAGLQDLLQVQNADLSRRQARVQMLEQQFNYRTGLIDLEYSIGVPFGTLSSQGSLDSRGNAGSVK